MKQTWRWFGPADEIRISEIRMTGAEGIVTALHHVATGEVWTVEEIRKRQAEIGQADGVPSGLRWDVVESLPVSEDIKRQTGNFRDHYAAYRQSLEHLAQCGIETVCYNFMPVLDWTRTELAARQPSGATAMHFDLLDFAAFDLFILERSDAREDYSDGFVEQARQRAASLDDADRNRLVRNIVAGLPGSTEHWSLEGVREQIARYDRISAGRLRDNLIDFLSEVVPTAERLGLRLCCHPDDPPFPLLGLPRIMSTIDDYAHILTAVDTPASGVTFCTGSLGVAENFDPVAFVERLGGRIHFVHLRNTTRHAPKDGVRTSFHESEHLAGDTDMAAAVHALMREEKRRREAGRTDREIPMRPDHGQSIISDLDRPMMPGYPLAGRMRGLAELRGIMAGYRALL